MRRANWVVPTCPKWMFLIVLMGGFEFKFPLFLSSSHQIPFVHINNSSKKLFSSSSQIGPIKFLLFPSIAHQSHFVPINFLLFPTQPYINPHKALNFGIRFFFCNLKTWLLRWFHGKTKKLWLKKEKNWETQYMYSV